MILFKKHPWILVACSLALSVRGEDMPPSKNGADPDLPQPLDFAKAQDLIDNSPFTRTLNLSDSLVLTGLAYVDGRPVATVVNRSTRETFIVADEPNVMGWKLAATAPGNDLKHSQVKINIGAETVVVRYAESSSSKAYVPGGGDAGSFKSHSSAGGPTSLMAGSPSGSTHVKTSSLLGDGGSERYKALSSEARERFKGYIDKYRASSPNATPEQLSAYAQKIFPKIESADLKAQTKTTAAAPATASVKVSKKSR